MTEFVAPVAGAASGCTTKVALEPGLYESVTITVGATAPGACSITAATIYDNGVSAGTLAITLNTNEGASVKLADGPNTIAVHFNDGEQWSAGAAVSSVPGPLGPPTGPSPNLSSIQASLSSYAAAQASASEAHYLATKSRSAGSPSSRPTPAIGTSGKTSSAIRTSSALTTPAPSTPAVSSDAAAAVDTATGASTAPGSTSVSALATSPVVLASHEHRTNRPGPVVVLILVVCGLIGFGVVGVAVWRRAPDHRTH